MYTGVNFVGKQNVYAMKNCFGRKKNLPRKTYKRPALLVLRSFREA